MEDWKLTSVELPKENSPVIANIEHGNHIYCEFLRYDSHSKFWFYNNGSQLEEDREVTAWMIGPGNLING